MYSDDLTREPWIPCVTKDGAMTELGLRDLFSQAHILKELAGESPLVNIALFRLLIVCIHRILDGPSKDVWEQAWKKGSFDPAAADAYFDKWAHRFDLFHLERPFAQAKGMAERLTAGSEYLVFDRASKQEGTLFDHTNDSYSEPLTCSEATRLLLVRNYFSLGGLDPADNVQGKVSSKDSIPARGATLSVRGQTLFESLLLNTLTQNEEGYMVLRGTIILGVPQWEIESPSTIQSSDAEPNGYLDYLSFPSRAIELIPSRDNGKVLICNIRYTEGLRLDGSLEKYEPFMALRLSEAVKKQQTDISPWFPLRFSEDKALWRDSLALIRGIEPGESELQTKTSEVTAAAVCRTLRERRIDGDIPEDYAVSLLASGQATEQKKWYFWRQERFPVPTQLLESEAAVMILRDGLFVTEETARSLNSTLTQVFLAAGEDPKKWKPTAYMERYWSALDLPFRALLRDLGSGETAIAAWNTVVRREALATFDAATEDLTTKPAAWRESIRMHTRLVARLNKLMGISDDSERRTAHV